MKKKSNLNSNRRMHLLNASYITDTKIRRCHNQSIPKGPTPYWSYWRYCCEKVSSSLIR